MTTASATLIDQALVTLKELREVHSGGSDDKAINAINIASLKIRTWCRGWTLVQETFTQDYEAGVRPGRRGGAKRLALGRAPIVSVTSITDDDSNTIAATDYTVIANSGELEHDSMWPAPVGRWTVFFVAGEFANVAAVSWDVKEACRIEAARQLEGAATNVQTTSLSGRAGSRSVSRSPMVMGMGLLPETKALLGERRLVM